MQKINDEPKIDEYLAKHNLASIFSNKMNARLSLYAFEKGEIICAKGDELHSLFMIVKGKTKIYKTSAEGNVLILRFNTPLAIVGDIEYVNDMKALNTVETVSDGELIVIDYDVLRTVYSQEVNFLEFLLKVIAHKFYTESQSTGLNLLLPVETRLASYLLSVSSDVEGNLFYDEMKDSNLTEIAGVIGTSYRQLNRVIKKLTIDGAIRRHKGSIYIEDLDLLKEIAHGHTYE